jgi:predicted nuclease of predicted toxin-antitoxin system
LDRVDRRIIAVAKSRKLIIFSKDNDLLKIAGEENVKTI